LFGKKILVIDVDSKLKATEAAVAIRERKQPVVAFVEDKENLQLLIKELRASQG